MMMRNPLQLAVAGGVALLLLVIVILGLWLARPPAPPPFDLEMQALLETHGLQAASVGVAMIGTDGEPIVGWNEGTALTPASTLKTLAAAVGLALLGEEYRFPTVLESSAPPEEGVVEGDLILRGSGDPVLSVADVETLAQALYDAGIVKVTGGIVADATRFPEPAVSDHWNWGDVGNAYGAGVYGINLERNSYRAAFDPAQVEGEPAEFLGPSIDLPEVKWRNQVTTGPRGSGDGVVIYGGPYAGVIDLRGTVPLGEPGFSVGGAIPDPPLLAAWILRQELERLEIEVQGSVSTRRGLAPAEPGVELARVESPPLKELARDFLATSDNVLAQTIFLAAGGKEEFIDFWGQQGLEFGGLRIEDGSGLARANRIRAVDLAMALHLAARERPGAEFPSYLSNSEVGPWKGGAMSGVRARAGYFSNPGQDPVAYAILINGLTPEADAIGFLGDLIPLLRSYTE